MNAFRAALAVLVISVLLAFVYLRGTVIARDGHGRITEAFVDTGGGHQTLTALPGQLWIGFPQSEGSLSVRCQDGSTEEGDYVTITMHTWDWDAGCRCKT
jgi:hypothetical protein